MRLALALLAGLLLASPAPAQVAQPVRPLDRRPTTAIDFDQVPLEDVLRYLQRASTIAFVPDWPTLEAAGVTRDTPVTLTLGRAPTRVVLKYLLRGLPKAEPLAWYVDDGIVRITTQAEADKDMVVVVYDVRDLLVEVPDFFLGGGNNGGGAGAGGGGFGGGNNRGNGNGNADDRGEALVELITRTVRPDVWERNGGQATIELFQGQLVIKAPRSVHAQL